MAYTPVTKKKEGTGYVPVTKKAAETPSLRSFLPTLDRIQQLSTNPPPPLKLTPQQFSARERERGMTISQGEPEKITPLRKLARLLPMGFEQNVYEPIAKVGRALFPSPTDYQKQIIEENPNISNEELQTELRKRMSSFGDVPLTSGPITKDTRTLGLPDIPVVSGLKKVGQGIIQRITEAADEKAAATIAKEIGVSNPSKKLLQDIIKASDETKAQAVIERAQAQATLPSLPKPASRSTEVTADTTPEIYKPGSKFYVDTNKVTKDEYVKSNLSGIGNQRRGNAKMLETFYNDQARRQKTPTPVARLASEPQPDSIVARSKVQEELSRLESEREVLADVIRNDPAGRLVGKVGRGDNTLAQLQENAIKRGSNTNWYNDVDELGFKDLDEAQAAIETYRRNRERLNELDARIKEVRSTDKQVAKQEKAELSSLAQYADQVDTMELAMPKQPTVPTAKATKVTPTKKRYTPVTKKTTAQAVPAKKTLPTLPKLSPEVVRRIETDLDSKTINEAIRTRYRSAVGRPAIPNDPLAKLAQSDGGDGVMKNLSNITGRLLTPISSRLSRINPKLGDALRKLEFGTAQGTSKDMARVAPLTRSAKKMSKDDRAVFDLARMNGDREVYEALARKYGLTDELVATEKTIEDIRQRANAVGMKIPKRENYFPRMIKNPEQYVAWWRSQPEWGDINRLINAEAEKRGIKVTDLWKDKEKVASIINNYVRGFGDKTVLAAPSFAKSRKIEVLDDELAKFYESADEALTKYVIRMNDEIEARKFFGKKADGDTEIEDSIGTYIMDLVAKGEIKPQQQEEVSNILRARFKRGSMNGALDLYRNAEYISTMGSPISAITQIGDFAWSLYENGWWNTAKGLLGKKKLTREDLGFDAAIMNEFTRDTWSGKAVDTVFKAVGLDKLSRLGQETFINANLSKLITQAQNGDKALITELNRVFDPQEAKQALQELSKGEITDRTKYILFSRMLDYQPLAKSEMPEIYLSAPNGRLFYMLKTFTIKQYDIFRREAIDKIQTGDPKQIAIGMKNLIHLAGLFMIANATSDEIKDLILGRETEPSDRVIDNLWRLVGASKYDVYKAREEGVGATVFKKILFPSSIIDRGYKDVQNFMEDKQYERGDLEGEKYKLESTQTIPFAGKLYYWWFGRGDQKQEYKDSMKPEESVGLPTLPELPKLPKLPSI